MQKFCFSSCSKPADQVNVSKAKKTNGKDQPSEPVQPKTLEEQTKARLSDWLKAAAQSRTQSLTLSGLDFAAELRKQLLASARFMETSYQEVVDALERKAPEHELKALNKKLDDQEKNNCKLQAHFSNGFELLVPISQTLGMPVTINLFILGMPVTINLFILSPTQAQDLFK